MITVPPPDPEYNKKILNDPRYPTARFHAKLITIIGASSIAFLFFYHQLDAIPGIVPVLVVVYISIMPASIFLVAYYRGIVWYNFRTTVPNPSPLMGLFAAAIGLVAAGMITHSFVSYGRLFMIPGILSLVPWVAMLLTTSEFKKYTGLDIGNIGALLFICYIFCFGAYTVTNCVFDYSEAQSIPTMVTDKKIHENSDHEESFYVHYQPVAGIDSDHIEVHETFYKKVAIGDSLNVKLKPGLWNNPWYYLDVN